jgi:glycosyltransferase involved in cell wall biosynthesis
MQIDICLCTHNPRTDVLERVMASIRHQQMRDGDSFCVVLVDNASAPPITEAVFASLKGSAISTRLLLEPLPGIARARAAAAEASTAEWILFVDDDNELDPDYVLNGLKVIRNHPKVGCFGGKLLLHESIRPPSWTRPFLPFLGIKDAGDQRIEQMSDHWGPWEPPTAGAFVHRDVLLEYLRRTQESENLFRLGRRAGKLFSGEDSLIMLGAAKVGRSNAYEPSLVLKHHLAPHRFRFRYLIRLMYCYGISHVVLDTLMRGPQPVPEYYKSRRAFLKLILWTLKEERKKPLQYALGKAAYHFGARLEHFSQQNGSHI